MRDRFYIKEYMHDALSEFPTIEAEDIYKKIDDYVLNGIDPRPYGNFWEKIFFKMCLSELARQKHILEKQNGRRCSEYHEWRRRVYERDNFTCSICGQVGGKLNAHHIKKYSEYPELRYETDNGITLCEACHREVHHGKK